MAQPTFEQPMLFLSDVHLGGFSEPENERIESELIQLINYCHRNEIRIAILGDLFDYWMEYPGYVPEIGKNLLNRFEAFNNDLGPTLFVTGNHDNWTRGHLKKRGFHLEHEHYLFTISNKKIMTLHGDGLSEKNHNLSRPILHRMLRNEKFIHFYQRLLPPKAGIKMMKYFSRFTRFMERESSRTEKLNTWAEEQLRKTNTDIILCGHDHQPRRKQFPFGTYINLGTFYSHKTMAYCNNNAISLVCWEPVQQSLKQFDKTN
ncbi:MAG: metallophosphoesterase family protein [Balneolaceae bacterium]|jgi:UDP-2,3-diacylglucosamine pyrophosphatase LpxH